MVVYDVELLVSKGTRLQVDFYMQMDYLGLDRWDWFLGAPSAHIIDAKSSVSLASTWATTLLKSIAGGITCSNNQVKI